jgi:hypothetical protein
MAGKWSAAKDETRVGIFSLLCRSHLAGFLVAFSAFFGTVDLTQYRALMLGHLGLTWLSSDIPPESSLPEKVQQEVGEGIMFQWRGDETRVFFLKEKRSAVERALQKEHITVEE